jgi:uncharacterized protein (TIGR00290 family)
VTRPRTLVAWSTGKDCAWALSAVRAAGEFDVAGLLATVAEDGRRMSMHGVREELAEAQAAAAGLPLRKVYIPAECPDELCEEKLSAELERARGEGVSAVVYGDLYLADLREYRERQLARLGMTALFPLWHRGTASLAAEMLAGGLRARVTCLDPRKMPRKLSGAEFDEEFLHSLPAGVDPCGENGEFHTFCYAGPAFSAPIAVRTGETVERGGFVFTDLTLAPS